MVQFVPGSEYSLHYSIQPLNSVEGYVQFSLWESLKTHKHMLWEELKSFWVFSLVVKVVTNRRQRADKL